EGLSPFTHLVELGASGVRLRLGDDPPRAVPLDRLHVLHLHQRVSAVQAAPVDGELEVLADLPRDLGLARRSGLEVGRQVHGVPPGFRAERKERKTQERAQAGGAPHRPLCPNPPSPRAVSLRSAAAVRDTLATWANTSCATRSPRCTT